MEMPKPTDAHKKLQKLIGAWSGEEKLFPSPWDPIGGMATGRVQNRAALDGFAVIQDYSQERGGLTTYLGHGVFGWDAQGQSYTFHWFDSMGMPPNLYRGNFQGAVLSMTHKGPQGHSRAIFDFSKEGKYYFKMEMSQDGNKWMTFMEGNYTK